MAEDATDYREALARTPQVYSMRKVAGLTPRQRLVLQFIASRWRAGAPPTLRDIMAAFGWASPQAVLCHLKPLEAKGYITRLENTSRSITLTGAAVRLEYADDEAGERLRRALEGTADE